MPRLFHPLLHILANATHRDLAAQIQYLKAENEILRSKLPKRVQITTAERPRLVKLGKKVGGSIRELITIVTPRTFARWVSGSGGTGSSTTRKPVTSLEKLADCLELALIARARDTMVDDHLPGRSPPTDFTLAQGYSVLAQLHDQNDHREGLLAISARPVE